MKKHHTQQIKALRVRIETLRILDVSGLALVAGGSVVSSDSNGAGRPCPSFLANCQQF
jgi:hypothetical protein